MSADVDRGRVARADQAQYDPRLAKTQVEPRRARKAGIVVHTDLTALVKARRADAGVMPPRLREMLQRDGITREQAKAGERLSTDWAMSGLDPRASKLDGCGKGSSYATPGGGPKYQDYTKAMRALGSDLQRAVVWSVCLWDVGVEQYWRGSGLSRRAVRQTLDEGLRRLAEHYGIGCG